MRIFLLLVYRCCKLFFPVVNDSSPFRINPMRVLSNHFDLKLWVNKLCFSFGEPGVLFEFAMTAISIRVITRSRYGVQCLGI